MTAIDYLIIVGFSEAFLCIGDNDWWEHFPDWERTNLLRSVISIIFTGARIPLGDDPWQHFPGTERYLVGTVLDFHCERRVICDCVPVGNPHKKTGGCLTENKYRMSERNRQRLGVFGIPVGGRGTAFATPELTDKITHIFETGV